MSISVPNNQSYWTPLPYEHNALEPVISAHTVNLHHTKHHKGYADKLSALVQTDTYASYSSMSLEDIIRASHANQHDAIFNNAAQVWNHHFYWHSLRPSLVPCKTDLSSSFHQALQDAGGMDSVINQLLQAGVDQFASGWAWLVRTAQGAVAVRKTSNALPVWLSHGDIPLLVLDVWEHAYYVDYENRRSDHLQRIKDILNWTSADERFQKATLFTWSMPS